MIADLLAASSLPPGARVLDFGCADRPYEQELPDEVAYVGADLVGNDRADVTLRGDGTVPLPDASFDLVMSTQVLEHVEDTPAYLAECHRLLRPDGTLVLSTHGVMYYHRDPEDYWRWTKPGLTKVLEEAGFEVLEARGVLALAAAAIQIFQDATMWKVPRRLQRPYALVNQVAMRVIDGRYEEVTRVDNCLTLAVRARRVELPTQ